MTEYIKMMALVQAPTYYQAVKIAQESVDEMRKNPSISHIKVHWRELLIDDQYNIKIYYDWEV